MSSNEGFYDNQFCEEQATKQWGLIQCHERSGHVVVCQ
jgi:hypothetical protein